MSCGHGLRSRRCCGAQAGWFCRPPIDERFLAALLHWLRRNKVCQAQLATGFCDDEGVGRSSPSRPLQHVLASPPCAWVAGLVRKSRERQQQKAGNAAMMCSRPVCCVSEVTNCGVRSPYQQTVVAACQSLVQNGCWVCECNKHLCFVLA